MLFGRRGQLLEQAFDLARKPVRQTGARKAASHCKKVRQWDDGGDPVKWMLQEIGQFRHFKSPSNQPVRARFR